MTPIDMVRLAEVWMRLLEIPFDVRRNVTSAFPLSCNVAARFPDSSVTRLCPHELFRAQCSHDIHSWLSPRVTLFRASPRLR